MGGGGGGRLHVGVVLLVLGGVLGRALLLQVGVGGVVGVALQAGRRRVGIVVVAMVLVLAVRVGLGVLGLFGQHEQAGEVPPGGGARGGEGPPYQSARAGDKARICFVTCLVTISST